MTLPKPRYLFLVIFIGCAGLLGSAIFIEPFSSMDPCPMCMMQRVVFCAIGLCALLACLHNPDFIGQKVYAGLTTILSVAGASVAMRQLWLQSLPEEQVPACGPGIDYMLEVFPILEVIEMAIRGTGDCAKVQWTLMNISIPGWSLLAFIGMSLLALCVLFKKRNK